MIGQNVGHYKIISKLGSGGMGEVYLAEDTTLDRKVALKFLPEALSQNPEARERLLREAKAASKLNHSNIVTVHAVGRDADRDFIAMEYVDGRPLDEYLGEKKRSTDELLRIAVQMARALEHAHAAGIIHRDLKPANIFIDREDRVRILDFGLASLPGARKLTQTGSTVGTIAYMAPEQVQGQEADERSDLFSFGILLYEMLAGRPPFGGDHHAAIMYSILNDTPAPLSQFRPDILPGIEALVMRVLEKDPTHRYQSARDILADLRRLREGSGPSRIHPAAALPVKKGGLPKVVIPAALVTIAVVILLVLQPWKVEVSPNQEAQAVENRLAIMYFDNLSDPADPKRLGEIAANLLITSLSESKQLQVVSSQRLYDILKMLGREGEKHIDRGVATQVADRAGARWMLMGTILQSEPFLVVTSQIVELASGNAIASQKAEGTAGENIFVVADRLTSEIRDDLALSAVATAGRPSAQAATQSEDAYRYYLEGMDNIRKLYYPEAEAAFRKALSADSTFAMAYVQLALMGRASPAELQTWIAAARRFSQGLSDRDRRKIDIAETRHGGTNEKALAVLQDYTRDFPDDIQPMIGLGVLLRRLGRHEESLEVTKRILALDSMNAQAYNQLAYTYHDLGDYDKSITAINRYIELVPDQANPYDSRGDLYAYQGKFAEAQESYRRAIAINPAFYMSLMKLGDISVLRGDYAHAESCYSALSSVPDRESRAISREGFAISLGYQGRFREAIAAAEAGMATDRMEKYEGDLLFSKGLARARSYEALGEAGPALSAVTETVELYWRLNPSDSTGLLPFLAYYNELNGDARTADSILKVMERAASGLDSAQSRDDYLVASAAIELNRGNAAEARGYLLRIPQRHLGFTEECLLARTHLALSEPAEAIALLEKHISTYDDESFADAYFHVLTHYWLGLAYEQSGWTRKAIDQYERFLERWKNADSGIREIDDARARLAALRAQAG